VPTFTSVYSATATAVIATTFRPVDPDERPVAQPEPVERAARTPRDKVSLSADAKALAGQKLTAEQERQIAELRSRDAEVRAHEAAHQAAAGTLGGGASFSYVMGPDGRQYAVGGEVPIQLRSGRTPEETLANAERVARAALAPANPSAQDLAVAGAAARMAADARAQKARAASKAYSKQPKAAGDGEGNDAEAQPLRIIGAEAPAEDAAPAASAAA